MMEYGIYLNGDEDHPIEVGEFGDERAAMDFVDKHYPFDQYEHISMHTLPKDWKNPEWWRESDGHWEYGEDAKYIIM